MNKITRDMIAKFQEKIDEGEKELALIGNRTDTEAEIGRAVITHEVETAKKCIEGLKKFPLWDYENET